MRLIEKLKCIRNFTGETTISSVPSASNPQPAMTLFQVRDLLAENRKEYHELIKLENKLSVGGNDSNEAKDESEEEDGEDWKDEEDGEDTNDGEDEDDDDTNDRENDDEDDDGIALE
ncbi:FK506-binding protein 4-like [Asparagus officinalis]|uniref:FK506-binding protein 4-like n=1 Tax=Asparagus officinalis TaxID=4686 RepID=UPI00098E44AC|nr:FK506-binding protein 4-like [Asparagus officinalis]